jgi:hypothetical protein
VTPSGIEPATFRLVAQCLNQLHCVPPIIEVTGWISVKFDGRAYIENSWGNSIMDYVGLRL